MAPNSEQHSVVTADWRKREWLLRHFVCLGWSAMSMMSAPVAGALVLQPLPAFEAVKAAHRPSEMQILDRHGVLLGAVRHDFSERRGRWVTLGDVSPVLQRAVLLSEDRRFHEHGGVDWAAVAAAGWNWVWGGSSRGASTLSMQLAGMLDPSLQRPAGGRTLEQKLHQVRQARHLEAAWSKAQILETYLNLAAFRGELRGIDAVSRVMFGKHPHGLDKRESAVAAALLRGPNADAARVTARACSVLAEMAEPAMCTTLGDHVEQWLAGTARVAADTPTIAPHFARLVAGLGTQSSPLALSTTLDAGLQQRAMQSVQRHLAGMAHSQLTDAAVVVLDNRGAQVLAYVGSSAEASTAAQVDHARARRQAGSALKPLLYAQALEARYLTAASLLEDAALDVTTASGLYIPQNYDRQYAGLVSVRSALASSLNIPAVRVLMLLGVERFAERLRSLGLPLEHEADHYGYSLSLGSADVDLLSLTNAYRTLADEGRWREPVLQLGLETDLATSRQLMDPLASWLVGDILSDRSARVRTFGLESPLATPYWSAVKTGTSKDMRDNWAVGWSSHYTVGVWVGNSQGLSMRDVSGVSGAAPIWHEVMSHLHAHQISQPPAPPSGLERRSIVFANDIEASRLEYFLPGTALTHVTPATRQASVQARIVSPGSHTILAVDPDMPASLQRLVLKAQIGKRPDHTLRWLVGGREVARGAQAYWLPEPGWHSIALSDEAGQVLDEIRIQVRGIPGVRFPGTREPEPY